MWFSYKVCCIAFNKGGLIDDHMNMVFSTSNTCLTYVPNVQTIVGLPHAYPTHHLMLVPTSLFIASFCSLTRQLNSDGCFLCVCDHTTIQSKPDLIFSLCNLWVPPQGYNFHRGSEASYESVRSSN
jgi:hypothetical protein